MENRLPKKLNKEPLVDAIFEVRFTSTVPASEILPGVFFRDLKGDKTISPLPASQIPAQMRNSDVNLQFAPVNRLDWDHFFISFSDKSLSISCKLPYPGWKIFKVTIEQILGIIVKLGIIESISRYSLKYVDLIPASDTDKQISLLNLDLSIAKHILEKEIFQVRVEIPKSEYINVVQIVSPATVTTSDETKQGVIVDIDTIKNVTNISIQQLMTDLSTKLDEIHLINKTIFFDCLKPDTIKALEPKYEPEDHR